MAGVPLGVWVGRRGVGLSGGWAIAVVIPDRAGRCDVEGTTKARTKPIRMWWVGMGVDGVCGMGEKDNALSKPETVCVVVVR
jgi:hypothetical protein